MNNNQCYNAEPNVNDILLDRNTKLSSVPESPKNRSHSKILPSKFSIGLLKRQQSLGYEKNVNVLNSPVSNGNKRSSVKGNNVHHSNNQSK